MEWKSKHFNPPGTRDSIAEIEMAIFVFKHKTQAKKVWALFNDFYINTFL